MNLLVAVSFQNCKQTASSTGEIKPTEISPLSPEIEDQPLEEPPTTVGVFPGEKPEIILFEPNGMRNSLPLINIVIERIDSRLGEAHFILRGETASPSITSLSCTHSYRKEDQTFDCTHLEEFIIENLEPGTHRLRFILTTDANEPQQSRTITFNVTE